MKVTEYGNKPDKSPKPSGVNHSGKQKPVVVFVPSKRLGKSSEWAWYESKSRFFYGKYWLDKNVQKSAGE